MGRWNYAGGSCSFGRGGKFGVGGGLAFASFSGEGVRFAGGFAGLDWVFVLEMNREDAKDAKDKEKKKKKIQGAGSQTIIAHNR